MVSKISDSSTRTKKLFLKLNKIAEKTSTTVSPETVHDLRTTARRVETLLSTHAMNEHGPTGKLAKQLAKLRRGAGKLRDIDVHIDDLDIIRLEDGSRDKATLREHLTKSRNKRQEKLVRTLHKEVSKGLLKRMKRAAQELADNPDNSPPIGYTAQALTKFAKVAHAYPHLGEKTLHNFRIDCKRIRYLAEIGAVTPDAERVVSLLKTIQDAVGEWHDWLTLLETAKDVLPASGSSVVAAVRTQANSKLNEALRITTEARRDLLVLATTIALPPDVPRPGAAATERNGGSRVGVPATSHKEVIAA